MADFVSNLKEVTREARSQGLSVEHIPEDTPLSQREKLSAKRCLLINRKFCQIISTKIQIIRNPAGMPYPCVRIYSPKTNLPRFLIYIVQNAERRDARFYVLPRHRVRKDTFRRVNKLRRYAEAWHWLRGSSGGRKAIHEELPLETVWAVREARRHSLDVLLLRGRSTSRRFLKHQIIVEGEPCLVRRASYLSTDPRNPANSLVGLRAPKHAWGRFMIYVLLGRDKRRRPRFYVLPHGRVKKTTTTTVDGWFADYENRWEYFGERHT